MKRRFLITTFVFAFYFIANAQDTVYPDIIRSTDWVLYQENNGVEQYYKFQECHLPNEGYHRENVLIKLVNKTPVVKEVSWDNVMWYGENCINCDANSPEEHRSVILQPNETQEAKCEVLGPMTLKLFSKFLNYDMDEWFLIHFEFRNFTAK
jgi:hypothetical protein